jgi:hypothetical protein
MEEIRERVFIVGTARSGTTLLQSMLSSHSEIFSFPETHFFSLSMPKNNLYEYFLWAIKPKNIEVVEDFLKKIDEYELLNDLDNILPKFYFSKVGWGKLLISILDKYTKKNGYNIWIEKTPLHLRYIDIIHAVNPNIKFIHIIRNGKDVVASMYEVTHKYPQKWGGYRSIEQCIDRWKTDICISKKYLGISNHSFVFYEDLIDDPESVSRKLLSILNLEYEKEIVYDYKKQANKIIFAGETWKNNTKKEINKSNKFYSVFSQKQQIMIGKKIKEIDLSPFNKYKI